MIRSVRRRHGVLILALLAVTLPLAVLAILRRPALPLAPLPAALGSSAPLEASVPLALDGEVGGLEMAVSEDGTVLEVRSSGAVVTPAAVVFCAPRSEGSEAEPPWLRLGPLPTVRRTRFELPAGCRTGRSQILLWSAGRSAVLASSVLPLPGESAEGGR